MKDQIRNIIERMLKAKNCQLMAVKQSPRKFLKVPSYATNNPEYTVLHGVKKLDNAFFVIVEGSRQNIHSAVFAVIGSFVFELDEYSFEALGMDEDLANYYYEFIGDSSTNYAFNF